MFSRTMIGATFALAGLLVAGQPARAAARALSEPPGVRIWTNHGEVYQHAERVQVFFRTEHDAYVTVLRVDTDGRVRVLFPLQPGDPNLARGGETYTVPGVDDHDAFLVDDAPGVGYVYAVASQDPFDYGAFAANDQWSFQTDANLSDGRIHGDPAASLQELVQHIMPDGYANYDTHLLPYDVEQQYDYPRFLCYDCHAYTPYAYWDPYSVWCPQFSLAVYFNPFYFYPSYWYPTRYYGGTNVVYVRRGLVGQQYLFRPRTGQAAPYTVYRDRSGAGMQPPTGGVRGVDVGGVGSVPAPTGRRTVGGGVAPGAAAGARQPAMGASQEAGRAAMREAVPAPVTNPRVVGPSATRQSGQDIAPVQARQRGVYIDAGARQSAAPATAGGAASPASRRFISQGASAQGSPGSPRSGGGTGSASPAARAAPRAAPAPRSAPALVRRRR